MSRDCDENSLIGGLYQQIFEETRLIEEAVPPSMNPSRGGDYDLPRGTEQDPQGPMAGSPEDDRFGHHKAEIPRGLEAGRKHKVRQYSGGGSWDRTLRTAVEHMRSRQRHADPDNWGSTGVAPPDDVYEDYVIQITSPPGYTLGSDKGDILRQKMEYRILKKIDAGGGHEDDVIRKVYMAQPPSEDMKSVSVLWFQRMVMLHPENDADLSKLDEWKGDPSPHWQAWEEYSRQMPDVEAHPAEAQYAKSWSKMLGDTDDASISYPKTGRAREREELGGAHGGHSAQRDQDEAKWADAKHYRDNPAARDPRYKEKHAGRHAPSQ